MSNVLELVADDMSSFTTTSQNEDDEEVDPTPQHDGSPHDDNLQDNTNGPQLELISAESIFTGLPVVKRRPWARITKGCLRHDLTEKFPCSMTDSAPDGRSIGRWGKRSKYTFHRPRPSHPMDRYFGYSWIGPQSFSIPLRILDKFMPDLVEVSQQVTWWIEDYNRQEREQWQRRLNISDEKILHTHLERIRVQTWQITQDYGIARWWFLKSTIRQSPFYPRIIALARHGASVADMACGLGHELRYLREDGAIGEMWGLDIRSDVWQLGLDLFKDAPGPGTFLHDDLLIRYQNVGGLDLRRVGQLYSKVDIFIMNGFPSFHSLTLYGRVFTEVMRASKIGSWITGWVFGSNYDNFPRLEQRLSGMVQHPKTFRNWTWMTSEHISGTRWDLDIKLVELEDMGLGSEMSKIMSGNGRVRIMALCYMAKRIQ